MPTTIAKISPFIACLLVGCASKAAHPDGPPIIDLKSCEVPPYSATSRLSREPGVAVVAVYVNSQGEVTEAEIEKSSGYKRLDEASIGFAQSCRFAPAYLHGETVDGKARVQYGWKQLSQ